MNNIEKFLSENRDHEVRVFAGIPYGGGKPRYIAKLRSTVELHWSEDKGDLFKGSGPSIAEAVADLNNDIEAVLKTRGEWK